MENPLAKIADAQTLAQAIVNTIPEPFIVLDDEFRVLSASRSFYETFRVDPAQTQGCLLYALGDGQWDIPALRLLLETIIPERVAMDGFEVEHDFPGIGRRIMMLNARKVIYENSDSSTILLAFMDITARRGVERVKEVLFEQAEELLRQKDVLLQEMQHRVANSLQIIASILLLKAKAVTSDETRHHLQEAHQRVMSVAAVQRHLSAAEGVDRIEVRSYLTKLCDSLALSMTGESHPIAVRVTSDEGSVESGKAVSLGLIVTELLINAIKYAFPVNKADAVILVTYEVSGSHWRLIVSDNGVGKEEAETEPGSSGLGTAIVNALTRQLDARIETESGTMGMAVTITQTGFIKLLPRVA